MSDRQRPAEDLATDPKAAFFDALKKEHIDPTGNQANFAKATGTESPKNADELEACVEGAQQFLAHSELASTLTLREIQAIQKFIGEKTEAIKELRTIEEIEDGATGGETKPLES